MTDREWQAAVKAGEDAGWKPVWERVIAPEVSKPKHREMMQRFSLEEGDLMGRLFEDMIHRHKIDLYRGEGSFEGWLRTYVRGYILNADPNKHGEISIEGAAENEDGTATAMELPSEDKRLISKDVWKATHWCFHDLWKEDPARAYLHLLKTRFQLSSEETKDFLEISSTANVDQIFSRNVKFMRKAWKG